MAQITTVQMQQLVTELAGKFGVEKSLQRIDIEPYSEDEIDGIVRIIIRLKDLRKANIADLQKLLSAVEESLSEQDERYPSVRFADAA